MTLVPQFPTRLHHDSAELVRDYFLSISNVDTVLVVNSCARGKAVPESDLDFAILVTPGTTENEMQNIYTTWRTYSATQPTLLDYKQLTPFSHLHLDVIDGTYRPAIIESGEPIDYFEIEIGNQICYSAPMDKAGLYFQALQKKWLPYYDNDLRLQRLTMTRNACNYDLDHIPFLVNRGLYFHAFDILCKAFQKYLQAVFITNKTYPIAYSKWIKEQVVEWLNKPDLYPKLSPILSVSIIESNEINEKANMLREILAKEANENL